MNLPVINSANFQVFSRDPNARRDYRPSWGAKTQGIKEGDYMDGILLGLETDPKFGSQHIILKSFAHGGSELLIWGCGSLQRALHTQPTDNKTPSVQLYFPGDVIRVTYKGSYTGKAGRGEGKQIAIFTIDEIVGYTMTNQDHNEVRTFQQAQLKAAAPVQRQQVAYQPPVQQIGYAPAAQAYTPPPVNVTTADDNSFDL